MFLPRDHRSLSIPHHCLKPHAALNSKQSGKFHFHVYPGGYSRVLEHQASLSLATPFTKIWFTPVSSHQNISITRSGPLSVLFAALPTDLRTQIPGEFLLNEQITMQECFKKQCQVQGGISC